MTVSCHVDDLNLLHEDEKEVTNSIKELEEICFKMRTTQGKKH